MSEDSKGKFAYSGITKLFHEKARLSILTSLSTSPKGIDFNTLKELCSLTDGNLSRHLQILQKEGLIDIEKSFINNKPKTTCFLTELGRAGFLAYIEELEKIVSEVSKLR